MVMIRSGSNAFSAHSVDRTIRSMPWMRRCAARSAQAAVAREGLRVHHHHHRYCRRSFSMGRHCRRTTTMRMTTQLLPSNTSTLNSMSTMAPRGTDAGGGDALVSDEEASVTRTNPAGVAAPYTWRNLLGPSARASWRASDPKLPEHLESTIADILKDGQRTKRQLRRNYERVLKTQRRLSVFRERDRRAMVNPGDKSSASNHQLDPAKFPPVYYGPDQTLADLTFRFDSNYAIAKRVLQEAKSLTQCKPQRVLDFGIGCGAASAAALEVFGGSIDWIHGIEPSHSMRECSERLLEHSRNSGSSSGHNQDNGGAIRTTFSSSLSAESTSTGGFDLILASYTASEIPHVTANLTAAAILFQRCNPGGIVVFIEPGTPDGFNTLRATRNMLLDCCPPGDPDFEWEERCHVIAPCTHNGKCPMERHKKNSSRPSSVQLAGGKDIEQDFFDGDDFEEIEDDNDVDGMDGFESDDNDYDDDDDDYDHDDEDDDFFDGTDESDDGDREQGSIEDADYIDLMANSAGLMSETELYDSSFCSFVQTMPGKGHKRKGEKFSYLVVQKRLANKGAKTATNARHGNDNDDDDAVQHHESKMENATKILANLHRGAKDQHIPTLEKYYQQAIDLEEEFVEVDDDELGLELLHGDDNRGAFGRIVHAPLKKRGHVYIDYCAAPGRIIRGRVTKSMNDYAPGIYASARKSRWGGYWPDTMEKVFSQEQKQQQDEDERSTSQSCK